MALKPALATPVAPPHTARRCSFCARSQSDDVRLVSGAVAYICEDCVENSRELFRQRRQAKRTAGNVMQRMVQAFHEGMDQPVGETPGMQDTQLRHALIAEEARETLEAIENNDFVGAIDGMCDLLYVVFGTAVAFGVDLQPYFEAVHASNMAKAGGPVRADGKRQKPPGWTPPDIAGLLEREKRGKL